MTSRSRPCSERKRDLIEEQLGTRRSNPSGRVQVWVASELAIELLLGKPLQYRYEQDLQRARKLYVGREDRPSNPLSKPTLTAGGPPVHIAYEVQPDERYPRRILILAIGAKPDIYDDAAARR